MPPQTHDSAPGRPRAGFYGWRIVAVCFATHFIGTGFIFYCYGVFFRPLQDLFGWSRLQVGMGLYVISIMSALFSPAVARIIERRGIRWTMITGTLVLATGFASLHFITSLGQYYAVLGILVAFGGVCVGPLPSNTVVANWFERHRGKALGAATTGISLSGLVLVPGITALVSEIGLRDTYLVIALLILVLLIPPVFLVIVGRPEDMGLAPDGDVRVPEEEADVPLMVPAATENAYLSHTDYLRSTTRVLAERDFWLLIASFTPVYMALGAILIHMIPHFTDIGLPPARSALALSIAAGAGVVGKIVFGYLADHVSLKGAVVISFAVQIAGTLLLLGAQTLPVVYTFSGLFGFGMGGVVPLQANATAVIFGRRAFASVSGLLTLVMVPIQAVGAPLAGWIFDHRGSYDLAWRIFLLNYIIATLVLLKTRMRPRWH
ncbi:MAG: MFS transporter [Myxococcota bacterium]